MNALTRFFCGREPRIDPDRILRRGETLTVRTRYEGLPVTAPDEMPMPETILKDSPSVTAFLCGSGQCFVKTYKFRSFLHSLKYVFRPPRAFRCVAAAEALLAAGFATPRPIFAAVRRRFGLLPVGQTLLTEALPPETVFLNREMATAPSAETGLAILRELAAFAAKLHLAGFLHGDLSLRNLYRVPDDRRFGLIDLDGLLLARSPFPRAAAVGELARIIAGAFRVSPNLPPREVCVREVLACYRSSGGMELRPAELLPVIRRLEKHRPPAPARH